MCEAPRRNCLDRNEPSEYHNNGSTDLRLYSRRPAVSLQKPISLPTPSASVVGSERIDLQSHGTSAPASYCVGGSPHMRRALVKSLSNTTEHVEIGDVVLGTLPADADADAGRYGSSSEDDLVTPETYFPGAPKLDPGHQFAAQEIMDELTHLAVEAFHSEHTRPASKRPRSPEPQRSRKRTRVTPLGCGRAERTSDPENSELFVNEHPVGRIWACPFYLKDKERHMTCLTRHCLLTIDDVKEHLCLMHREPNYCPICYGTFPTAKERDSHVRSRQCPRRVSVSFEGLTDAQMDELEENVGTAVNTPQSGIGQWYEIWHTVFPKMAPPVSPFFSAQRELNVYGLRRLWKVNGQAIVSDVLRRHGLQGYGIKNEERNLEALYYVVQNFAIDKLWPSWNN